MMTFGGAEEGWPSLDVDYSVLMLWSILLLTL
jgi:hypothetical protein